MASIVGESCTHSAIGLALNNTVDQMSNAKISAGMRIPVWGGMPQMDYESSLLLLASVMHQPPIQSNCNNSILNQHVPCILKILISCGSDSITSCTRTLQSYFARITLQWASARIPTYAVRQQINYKINNAVVRYFQFCKITICSVSLPTLIPPMVMNMKFHPCEWNLILSRARWVFRAVPPHNLNR